MASEYIDRRAGRSRWLAVDLGGSRLRVATVDADGAIVRRHERVTPASEGPDAIVAAIVHDLRDVARTEGLLAHECAALGVAAPGPLAPASGVVHATPNLPGWVEVPLAQMLRSALGLPVRVNNDANLAGLGEARLGAGRGCDPLLYLTVSTGVGGAILLGGDLVQGAVGLAGELGHVIVQADGPTCNFGHPGCLEALSSGTAIARRAAEAVADGHPTALARLARDGRQITARDVAEAARDGDALAAGIWNRAARCLGLAIGSLVNVFDPQRVVLGGGLTASWDLLRDPVLAGAAEVVMCPGARPFDLVPAALGDDAGLVGAALHAMAATDP